MIIFTFVVIKLYYTRFTLMSQRQTISGPSEKGLTSTRK